MKYVLFATRRTVIATLQWVVADLSLTAIDQAFSWKEIAPDAFLGAAGVNGYTPITHGPNEGSLRPFIAKASGQGFLVLTGNCEQRTREVVQYLNTPSQLDGRTELALRDERNVVAIICSDDGDLLGIDYFG